MLSSAQRIIHHTIGLVLGTVSEQVLTDKGALGVATQLATAQVRRNTFCFDAFVELSLSAPRFSESNQPRHGRWRCLGT